MQRSETVAEAIERADAEMKAALNNLDIVTAKRAARELESLKKRKDKTEFVKPYVR